LTYLYLLVPNFNIRHLDSHKNLSKFLPLPRPLEVKQ